MIKRTGFSLIELMVVIAIIGILTAIAIPAYKNYIIKSRVAELITQARGVQLSVEEYVQTQGISTQAALAAVTANLNGTYTLPPVTGTAVATIVVNAGGVIVVTGAAQTGPTTLTMTPTLPTNNGPIIWSCHPTPATWAPSTCNG